MSWFFDMLITALYTVFVQNLVFNGGYATSEAIRASSKPKSFFTFAVMISGFSVVTSVICRLVDMTLAVDMMPEAVYTAIYAAVLAAVYLIVAVFLRFAFKAGKNFLGTLGIAALNTLVFAVPFLNRRGAYTMAESIGSGLGAGVAFVLASALICKGVYTLHDNKTLPESFKGTPATFVYVAILSLAFSGFTGGSLFS